MTRIRGDSPGDTQVRIEKIGDKYSINIEVGFCKLIGWGYSSKCRLEDVYQKDKYTTSGTVILDNDFKIYANKLKIGEPTMKALEAEEEERRIAEQREFDERMAKILKT